MNPFEMSELEPSICTQLDTVGMQPHSREYLEREMNCMRSERVFRQVDHEVIDHARGVHFDGRP